jgi:thiosulfate dehydrogenase (quinone) large subunit
MNTKQYYIWTALRICLGWVFLWSFLDGTFGLGFSTPPGQGWINGVSPTYGYLAYATRGPLAPFFQSIAPLSIVNWLHMIGKLAIGLGLVFGVSVRLASIGGVVQMLLIYSAQLLPQYNPIIDEHIIYSLILMTFVFSEMPATFGLRKWWLNQGFVQQYAILQ